MVLCSLVHFIESNCLYTKKLCVTLVLNEQFVIDEVFLV